jgi:hypothetical protein
VITREETAREKDRLPRFWGRFGKSIDALAEFGEPDESLVAACIGLNPAFKHRSVTLAGGLKEMTESTNVVLAATNKRLIVLSTGFAGGDRGQASIPLSGLEVVEAKDKELAIRWPEGEMRVKGCAKPMLPALVEALRAGAG